MTSTTPIRSFNTLLDVRHHKYDRRRQKRQHIEHAVPRTPIRPQKVPVADLVAIPIASTAASTATGGAPSHASTAVRPVPITAWSSQPPHGDGVVLFSFIVRQRCDVSHPVQERPVTSGAWYTL